MDHLTITSIQDLTVDDEPLLARITDALGTDTDVHWDVDISVRRDHRRRQVGYSIDGRIVGATTDRIASATFQRRSPLFGKEWRHWGVTPNTDDDYGLHGAAGALWIDPASEIDRRLIAFDLAGAIVDTGAVNAWVIRRPGDTAGITVSRAFGARQLRQTLATSI